jgi:hypothetical protein
VVETGERVIAPPAGAHPFYKKYINAAGVVIVSSEKVPDAALLAARQLILHLSSQRLDVHKAILAHHPRISVMAVAETASDLPEFGPNSDGQWGLGQMPGSPTTLVSQKGICYEGNTDYTANFLLHEFVHDVHNLGMPTADPDVVDEIYAAYLGAIERGIFIPPADEPRRGITPFDAYGDDEYFTHSVNAYFDLNESLPGPWMDFKVGETGWRSGTRDELRQKDPVIYEIIERFFPDSLGDLMNGCRRSSSNEDGFDSILELGRGDL